MPYEFKTERTVEFAETDMAGILHFSNYFRFMEAAEHAFFRSLGLSVHPGNPATPEEAYGAARRSAACTFKRPLRYEDVVELHVLVKEKRSRSISYCFVFRRKPDLVEVARGEMCVVFVTKAKDGNGLEAIPIPPEIDARVEVAPPEMLA